MFDYYYLVLVVPALLFAAWAQMRVSSTFSKYSKVHSSRAYTGEMVARKILDANGLYNVTIEQVPGNLSDHYDPGSHTVRLSPAVYGQSTIAAIGVAAHECGHAVQHATHYAPLTFRNAIIPVTNFGSKLSVPMILIGFIMGYDPLITIGILLFALVAVFQLVTLPVEFNASSRALTTLEEGYYLDGDELDGAKKVLSVAALTYVGALLVSIAQVARLLLLRNRRRS